MDIRSLLPELTFEWERKFCDHLLDEGKIVVLPGEACHCFEPGFFRLTFMWADCGDQECDYVIENVFCVRFKRCVEDWKFIHFGTM